MKSLPQKGNSAHLNWKPTNSAHCICILLGFLFLGTFYNFLFYAPVNNVHDSHPVTSGTNSLNCEKPILVFGLSTKINHQTVRKIRDKCGYIPSKTNDKLLDQIEYRIKQASHWALDGMFPEIEFRSKVEPWLARMLMTDHYALNSNNVQLSNNHIWLRATMTELKSKNIPLIIEICFECVPLLSMWLNIVKNAQGLFLPHVNGEDASFQAKQLAPKSRISAKEWYWISASWYAKLLQNENLFFNQKLVTYPIVSNTDKAEKTYYIPKIDVANTFISEWSVRLTTSQVFNSYLDTYFVTIWQVASLETNVGDMTSYNTVAESMFAYFRNGEYSHTRFHAENLVILSTWPTLVHNPDGAYATVITSNDMKYITGSIVLGRSIDVFDSSRDRIALITGDVSDTELDLISEAGYIAKRVETIPEPWFGTSRCKYTTRLGMNQMVRWGRMASKLYIWDLDYDHVLYFDTDAFVTGKFYKYFDSTNGLLHPKVELLGEGGTGHRYINAGVLFIKPSKETFEGLLNYAKNHNPPEFFGNIVDCTEQALINAYFGKPYSFRKPPQPQLQDVDSRAVALHTNPIAKKGIGRPDKLRDYRLNPPLAVHFIRQDRCRKPWEFLSTSKKEAENQQSMDVLKQRCDTTPYKIYIATAYIHDIYQ